MREPPLPKRDDAKTLSPILQRLEQLLAAKQEREDVVEAIAALGESAGALADDIVRTHPEPKGDFDLDLESSKAMELIGPAATEHLLPLLKHKEARVRALAVLALDTVYSEFPLYLSEPREPPAEVVRAIRAMEEDPDTHVKEAAMRVTR